MLTAVLMIPCVLYLKNKISSFLKDAEISRRSSKILNILANLTQICMIIVFVGFFGVGFFSEDVAYWLITYGAVGIDLHLLCSLIFFNFIALSGMLLGIFAVFYSSIMQDLFQYKTSKVVTKLLGLEMMFLPSILCAIFLYDFYSLPVVPIPPSPMFWEWMLQISVFGWLLPLAFLTLRLIKRELPNK